MLLDISPLRRNRDFRFIYFGQMVSFLGSMVSYVAIPYQVHALTRSSMLVGLLGIVQLVPVLGFGLFGGAVADRLDRRKLLIGSELVMVIASLGLVINATLPRQNVIAIFALAFLLQAANAFHRPAMDALNQKLVPAEDLPAVSALLSVRGGAGAVLGPALGGWLLSQGGLSVAYGFDLATFFVALFCVFNTKSLAPAEPSGNSAWRDIAEGLRYARERPVLLGTYAIDIVAMTFAFPIALFPSMAESWGGESALGPLYAGMSAGALVISLFSAWTIRVRRHGAAVILAAAFWGLFIAAFGFAHELPIAFACLVLAGGADAISGIFRMTIWNQTIPNDLRGRLAGVEMISYLAGPLLGNARAGAIASMTSNGISVISGGFICFVAVILCASFLPAFWHYEAEPGATPVESKA